MPAPTYDPPLFLVVDDEAFVRTIVMRMVQALQFSVAPGAGGLRQIRIAPTASGYAGRPEFLQARTGEEALAILDGRTVDCIISDIRMPAISGVELLRAVRSGASKAPRATRFAMLTAHAEAELVSAAMALDVNAFLTKPVAAQTFEARLARLFTESWPLRAAAAYAAVPLPSSALSMAGERPVQSWWTDRTGPQPATAPVARPLEQVPENAILARPVMGPTRDPFLHQGTVLTRLQLNRLQELGDLGVRISEVWVYPPVE